MKIVFCFIGKDELRDVFPLSKMMKKIRRLRLLKQVFECEPCSETVFGYKIWRNYLKAVSFSIPFVIFIRLEFNIPPITEKEWQEKCGRRITN